MRLTMIIFKKHVYVYVINISGKNNFNAKIKNRHKGLLIAFSPQNTAWENTLNVNLATKVRN